MTANGIVSKSFVFIVNIINSIKHLDEMKSQTMHKRN